MEYQFKIQIKGITKPPVWRKVIVPASFTFLKFHNVIQTAFGWDDYHLFEFEDKVYQNSIRIAIPSEDDYDFGDHWVHEITLEATSDDKRKEAFCLSGKGSCPPEDCGGVCEYEGIKNIFRTVPYSEEADEFRDWLGLDKDETWDTDTFDIDEINACLKQI